MGIVPLSQEMLFKHVGAVGGLAGCRLMELGSQQMYCVPGIAEGSPAKDWFKAQGVKEHVSVDLNAQHGAVPVDLSKAVPHPEWLGAFDLVTDFGTSEHVGPGLEALYHCRGNCHDWCRPGGLLLFMNPKTGHWPGHGYHFFTMEHYLRLATACGYRVLEISEHPTLGNSIDGWQIHAALQRTVDAAFLPYDAYVALCDGTVFPK
jgi:hypothetical protein